VLSALVLSALVLSALVLSALVLSALVLTAPRQLMNWDQDFQVCHEFSTW
jgi:hypothetical protein